MCLCYVLALVFDMADSSDVIPTHVNYKIRMNVDMVDTTDKFRVLDRSVIHSITRYTEKIDMVNV